MNPLKDQDQGFTLVEICVALGLVMILVLALAQMNTMTAQNTQSSNASEEYNSDVNLLLTLINSANSANSSDNGCTKVFSGLPIGTAGANAGLPIISSTLAGPTPFPAPSPVSSFTSFIANPSLAVAPVGVFMSPSPAYSGALVQVSAPSAKTATTFFPAPRNNLWVTNLYFNQIAAQNFTSAVSATLGNITIYGSLYQLELDAQKISTFQTIIGGATVYYKDFLVMLWTTAPGAGIVKWCGPNPPQ